MDVGKVREEKTSCREGKKEENQQQQREMTTTEKNLLCFVFFMFLVFWSSLPLSRINNGHFLMPHNTTGPLGLMLLMFGFFFLSSSLSPESPSSSSDIEFDAGIYTQFLCCCSMKSHEIEGKCDVSFVRDWLKREREMKEKIDFPLQQERRWSAVKILMEYPLQTWTNSRVDIEIWIFADDWLRWLQISTMLRAHHSKI